MKMARKGTKVICQLLLLSLALAGATACGTQGSASTQNTDQTDTMDMSHMDHEGLFSIEFSTEPTEIHAGQEVKLIEHVLQKNKPIPDAEVKMEIWRDGETNHQKVSATGGQNGEYIVKQKFLEPATYHVILHTTANDMHQMPTKEIKVLPAK